MAKFPMNTSFKSGETLERLIVVNRRLLHSLRFVGEHRHGQARQLRKRLRYAGIRARRVHFVQLVIARKKLPPPLPFLFRRTIPGARAASCGAPCPM